jgi:pyruvyltransferase
MSVISSCFYYGGENFGDSVNKIFIDFLSEKKFSYNKVNSSPHYMMTGSVLHFSNSNSIIFGTGFISNHSRLGSHAVKKIFAVRGPLTRNKLIKMNIECPEVYGDPLILFPLIYNPSIQKKSKLIGIIQHYIDSKTDTLNALSKNLENNGYIVKVINILVGVNYKPFIDHILECETIISSSLHGIIMGVVYKKPTILVQFSNKVIGDLFKSNDFFGSLNIKYEINNTYDVSLLNNTISVDYTMLKVIGDKLIDAAPFIEDQRKVELKSKYNV